MKNYWMDEIQIVRWATLISCMLQENYQGKVADMDQWGETALWMMHNIKGENAQRVRDALMWRYTFKYELNEYDEVTSLKFTKLPWLV